MPHGEANIGGTVRPVADPLVLSQTASPAMNIADKPTSTKKKKTEEAQLRYAILHFCSERVTCKGLIDIAHNSHCVDGRGMLGNME